MIILVYGLNYFPELTGIGKYTGEMCEWLAKQGHELHVVTTPPYYPHWQVDEKYSAWKYRKEYINGVCVYRCPVYVPKKPKVLNRLLHLISFSLSSFPITMSKLLWKPDVVMTVEPTFFCSPGALLIAKLSGAKSLLHIQDFELDAMLGLGMGKKGGFAQIAESIECWVMRRFSAVSSISISMLEHAAGKLHNKPELILFRNWVDVNFVTPKTDASYFRDLWGISESTKVVLYAGNMGKKQGLELVLKSAVEFKNNSDVLFIMVGTGAAYESLKKLGDDLGLSNMQFHPLQAYDKLPNLMALADVHLVIQKKGVADAVLPSKLTTILSAGGTVLITAEAQTELRNLCISFPGIATCIEPENLKMFTKQLSVLLDEVNVNKRETNNIARDYALQNLSKEAVLTKFNYELLNLVN